MSKVCTWCGCAEKCEKIKSTSETASAIIKHSQESSSGDKNYIAHSQWRWNDAEWMLQHQITAEAPGSRSSRTCECVHSISHKSNWISDICTNRQIKFSSWHTDPNCTLRSWHRTLLQTHTKTNTSRALTTTHTSKNIPHAVHVKRLLFFRSIVILRPALESNLSVHESVWKKKRASHGVLRWETKLKQASAGEEAFHDWK